MSLRRRGVTDFGSKLHMDRQPTAARITGTFCPFNINNINILIKFLIVFIFDFIVNNLNVVLIDLYLSLKTQKQLFYISSLKLLEPDLLHIIC